MIDPRFVWDTFLVLLPGVPVTLKLTAISFVLGALLSVPIALMRMSGNIAVDLAARVYVLAFRGTPLLIQLFLIYYGVAQFAAIRHSPLWTLFREPEFCAVLAFTLNMAAYASETVRGGLTSVPRGQIEAGRAGGMSRPLLYRRVILPIAIRQALPAYGSEAIIMLKSTALASMVTIYEITGIASRLRAESYRVVEVLLAAAAVYLVMTFVIARIVRALELWLNPQARVRHRRVSLLGGEARVQ
jgi:octopine/nopaline transport system permease protein